MLQKYEHTAALTAALILLGAVLSLGCTRQITCKAPFEKSVAFFETKYRVNFKEGRDVVRYADVSAFISKFQAGLRNDELPALPVMLSAFIVQEDEGTVIKTKRYDPAACLEFCDGTYLIRVEPGGAAGSLIRVRRAGLNADIFSRDARRYLDIVQAEMESGKLQIRYRPTKLRNYGAIGEEIIQTRRGAAQQK